MDPKCLESKFPIGHVKGIHPNGQNIIAFNLPYLVDLVMEITS